jgi:hypothetical protein
MKAHKKFPRISKKFSFCPSLRGFYIYRKLETQHLHWYQGFFFHFLILKNFEKKFLKNRKISEIYTRKKFQNFHNIFCAKITKILQPPHPPSPQKKLTCTMIKIPKFFWVASKQYILSLD